MWEQAPDAIRSPDTAPPTGYRPPTLPQPAQPRLAHTITPLFPNATAASPMEVAKIPTVLDDFPPLKSDKTNDVTQDQDYGGDETATTHSQMTKSLATTQNKFTEMEAAIRKQQAALTAHKKEIELVNKRTFTSLELVQQTSADVLQLQEATTDRFNELKAAAEADAKERRAEFAMMKAMIAGFTQTQLTQQSEASDSSTGTQDSDNLDGSDTMSTQTVETDNQTPSATTSPRKQRQKRKERDRGLDSIRQNINPQPPHDQDPSAQYIPNSTPGAGTT